MRAVNADRPQLYPSAIGMTNVISTNSALANNKCYIKDDDESNIGSCMGLRMKQNKKILSKWKKIIARCISEVDPGNNNAQRSSISMFDLELINI